MNNKCRTVRLALLITAIVIQPAKSDNCSTGVFGKNCMFKCHCASSSVCDSNGVCLNRQCEPGYFGPYCQYLDIVYINSVNSTPDYLRDKNDSTCNPDTTAAEISVTLENVTLITWFRIVVNKAEHILDFSVTINDFESCINERWFRVDNNTLDVSCDPVLVSKITIIGPVAGSICSFMVSGGRNSAYKQNATQTSQDDEAWTCASNAVDGFYRSNGIDSFCTLTNKSPYPTGSLQYDNQQQLSKIVIYSSKTNVKGLMGFNRYTVNENGEIITNYTDTSSQGQYVYTIHVLEIAFISRLVINISNTLPLNERYLSLCEVETFGETVCTEGLYGLWCQQTCNCVINNSCNLVTGRCYLNCQTELSETECLLRCGENCIQENCQYKTEKCLKCKPGYEGYNCTACLPGYFGDRCSNICSSACNSSCNPINGTCNSQGDYFTQDFTRQCLPGYWGQQCKNECPKYCNISCLQTDGKCLNCRPEFWGPSCTDHCPPECGKKCNQTDGSCIYIKAVATGCSFASFGENCSKTCSRFCLGRTCDKTTGNCIECLGNRTGLHCDKCKDHTYGVHCEHECSEYCLNKTCDSLTGECKKCIIGRIENNCRFDANPPLRYLAPLTLLPLLILLFVCMPSCPVDDDDDMKKTKTNEEIFFNEGTPV